MPDLADVIREDHEIVADLLQRLTEPGDQAGRAEQADLCRRLVTTLSVHAAAEEQVVYPLLAEKVEGGDDLAAEARQEHQAIKELLAVIDRGRPEDPEVAAALRTVRQHVTEHVREEEDDLLPRLREAVGTPEMQRLRGVRQLGTAYLIFPGAQHTRFEHSLGTMHLTQRMVEAINRNRGLAPRELIGVAEDEARILRAAALVHDITHIPFGHSIEDQSGLLERHDSPERYRALLDLGRAQVGDYVLYKTAP